jgi:hypothetical protein
MLYSLGLPLPSDLEGDVPDGLFSPAFLADRPIERGAPTLAPDPFPDRQENPELDLDADAETEMMARLRALGYLE